MRKSGFTLIELLAVIAILAIILVISIPKILDVIETSKINTLKNAVQLIADSAEKKYTENEAFLEEEEITCDSVSKLNKEDYNKCTIIFDENGIAKVSILGRGKFKGLKVIEATKTSAEVIKLEAPKYGITAVEYINELYEYDGEGLKIDNTPDQNIRYYGSDPNNYVSFNNELWRIIGVFGDNVKLVRKDSLGELSWDSSESSVNNGWGVNEWSQSALKNYLNAMYYGGTSVTCYNGKSKKEVTCPTGTIEETSKSLIDYHTWNTGAPNFNNLYNSTTKSLDTVEFYKAERGTKNGKICTSGTYCNDTVTRTTEWTGYIALPYVTDWAYASSEDDCNTKMDKSSTYKCKNNNWMQRSTIAWYLSPNARGSDAGFAWYVSGDGYASYGYAAYSYAVAPSIYLKSNVLIESGNGTSSNPYILKAGA
jgi:prepilin-type N-terminal cleavage/methylation domain-containing protein